MPNKSVPGQPTPPDMPPKSLRVLFVDDEKSLREFMRSELTHLGHKVTVCADGRGALKVLEKSTFDVAILDLRMPGLTGIEVLEQLKQLAPETEAVVMTGHASMETAIDSMRLGAFDYITKPCKLAEIEAVLGKVAEKRGLERQNRVLQGRVKVAKAPQVFLSYRRKDSQDLTGRIYDWLVARYGEQNIFWDLDSIPLGVDFRKHLTQQVSRCAVLLAIIGRQWLEVTNMTGKRRLDDADDFVRIEIEAALQHDIPIIPVLVQEATLPTVEQLPPSLKELVFRQAATVRRDPDFQRDVRRLIRELDVVLSPPKAEKPQ